MIKHRAFSVGKPKFHPNTPSSSKKKKNIPAAEAKAAWRKKNIQLPNKCVCIGRLPGHASWALQRHLLTVALTRQSPAANAMWQCWDYNIWPVLPGINAITAPRPLRWATAGRGVGGSGNEGGVEKVGRGWWNRWMNLRKWERRFSSSERPVQLRWDHFNSFGGGGVFLSDFMPFQEDAFVEELWLIAARRMNHSVNNDVKIRRPRRRRTSDREGAAG